MTAVFPALVFRSTVATGGYRWVSKQDGFDLAPEDLQSGRMKVLHRDEVGPWLIPVFDPEVEGARTFQVDLRPERSRAAFTAFAGLNNLIERGEEEFALGVIAFANKFGPLGRQVALVEQVTDTVARNAEAGESIERWRWEVEHYALLFDLARLLGSGSKKTGQAISRRIAWNQESMEFHYAYKNRLRWVREPIASAERLPVTYDRLVNATDYERAWLYLSKKLNRVLERGLSARVPHSPGEEATFEPATLLDALYLRMYFDVAGIDRARFCKTCRRRLPPNVRRSRQYCNDDCKNAYWNPRRENNHQPGID